MWKKIVFALMLVVILGVLSACSSGGNDVSRTYDEALNAMKQGHYAEAADKLSCISFYSDSVELSLYCRAHAKAKDGDYDFAVSELQKLGNYRDSALSAAYFEAKKAEADAIDPASRAFAAFMYDREIINGFRDSTTRATEIRLKLYEEGVQAQENESWADAFAIFGALQDYQDSTVRYHYAYGRLLETESGDKAGVSYANAAGHYAKVQDYLDSAERMKDTIAAAYQKAAEFITVEDFNNAEAIYLALDDLCDKDKFAELQDAKEKAKETARQNKIAEANELLQERKFDEAKAIFLEVNETEMYKEAIYLKAADLDANGKPEEAAAEYREIFGYKDSRDQHYLLGMIRKETDPEIASSILLNDRDYLGAEEDLYDIALKATEAENYPLSISIYSEFTGEKDCHLRMMNDLYLYGLQLLQNDRPEQAASVFEQLDGVGSADLYANMARYAAAEELETKGAYESAATAFDLVAEYADAGERADKCRYMLAMEKKEKALYLEAAEIFASLGNWGESVEQEKNCRYLQAGVYSEQKAWEEAIGIYEKLKDYLESRIQCAECYRQLGEQQLAAGEAESAYRSFVSASDKNGQARAAFFAGEAKLAKASLNEALEWYKLAYGLPETEERAAMLAQSLLNMDEDSFSEQYASIIADSEKAKPVLYALANRSLERKDEESAMRQLRKAGDYADASEKFALLFGERIERLVAEEKYDEAIALCNTYGEQKRADKITTVKLQKEEADRQKALEIKEKEYMAKIGEAEQLLNNGKFDDALLIYQKLEMPEMVNEVIYQKAAALKLPDLYLNILDYKDSRELHYLAGKALLETDPENGYRIIADDIEYSDAQDVLYDLADKQYISGNYSLAFSIFMRLADQPLNPANPKPDCKMRALQSMYQYALGLEKQGEFELAADIFNQLSDLDSAQQHAKESYFAVAEKLEAGGKYEQAAISFEALGDFGDASNRAKKNRYAYAEELLKEKKYDLAEETLSALGDYEKAGDLLLECKYYIACNLMDNNHYEDAIESFLLIADYKDVTEKIRVCYTALGNIKIQEAVSMLKTGNTSKAVEEYQNAYSLYVNAEELEEASSTAYLIAACYQKQDNLDLAFEWYEKSGEAGDTLMLGIAQYALTTEQYDKANELQSRIDMVASGRTLYDMANKKLDEGNIDEAISLFERAGNFNDAKERRIDLMYQKAETFRADGEYLAAAEIYEAISGYKDADEKKNMVLYSYAEVLEKEENYTGAYNEFASLGGYLDSASRAEKLKVKGLVVVRVEKLTDKISRVDLKVGKTYKLSPTIVPEYATDKRLKWKSSDKKIATVDESGLVKAVRNGTCVITCSSQDGGGIVKYTVHVD